MSVNVSIQSLKSTQISALNGTDGIQTDSSGKPTSKQSTRSTGSGSNSTSTVPDESVESVKKENSMVRFDKISLDKKTEIGHRYLPHIHRQKTEILPKSRIQTHLEELNELFPHDKSDSNFREEQATRILNKFVPSLKSVSNLDFKTHYYLQNTSQFHQEPKTLYYILPFKYDSASVKHLDPGYVTFRLPKVDALKKDAFANVRSTDGTQLSPLKFQTHFEQLFTKTVEKLVKAARKVRFEDANRKTSTQENKENGDLVHNENVVDLISLNLNIDHEKASTPRTKSSEETEDIRKLSVSTKSVGNECGKQDLNVSLETGSETKVSKTHDLTTNDNVTITLSDEQPSPRIKWNKTVNKEKPLTFNLPSDWLLELVPAIFTSSKEPVYVMKPYEVDENPTSDLRWRICFAKRESKILKSIGNSDNDLRSSSVKLVSAILNCDTRLQLLKEYDVQTCLLHDMDDCVDETPRWQRETLESCVKSLINRISVFVSIKNLSHFFIPNFNLLDQWTASDFELAKSALERIVSSDTVLIHLIQKAIGHVSSPRNSYESFSASSSCSTSAEFN